MDPILHNIRHHNEYPDYLAWMAGINGLTQDQVIEKLTPDLLIGGYCEDFGTYFAYKYGVPMYFLNRLHDLIVYKGRYYDGYNVDGVDHLKDLEYVKRDSRVSDWSEEQLQASLVLDEDWKTYQVFTEHFYLINKQEGKHE